MPQTDKNGEWSWALASSTGPASVEVLLRASAFRIKRANCENPEGVAKHWPWSSEEEAHAQW
eukprot:3871934-Alexandrium_andersonii.AAC.1